MKNFDFDKALLFMKFETDALSRELNIEEL